jgi:hypothetical protein
MQKLAADDLKIHFWYVQTMYDMDAYSHTHGTYLLSQVLTCIVGCFRVSVLASLHCGSLCLLSAPLSIVAAYMCSSGSQLTLLFTFIGTEKATVRPGVCRPQNDQVPSPERPGDVLVTSHVGWDVTRSMKFGATLSAATKASSTAVACCDLR